MSKYWHIFKITWENNFEYRFNFVTHIFISLIELLTLTAVWSAVFRQQPLVGGYTFSAMFTYVVLAKFMHFATRSNFIRLIGNDIKDGKMSFYLVKPISYIKSTIASFAADRAFEIIIRLLILALAVVFASSYFEISSLGKIFGYFSFLFLSLILNLLYNLIFGFIAFWITDTRLFRVAIWIAVDFLAGSLVPIDLFPPYLAKIFTFLPFQYLLYFPIKIYQGGLSGAEITNALLISLFWIVAGSLLTILIWRKGIARYDAIGQ